MVLAGGLLLISPGVLTDLAGIALLLPWTRRWLAPLATRWLLARFKIELSGNLAQVGAARRDEQTRGPAPAPPPGSTPFDHPRS
jgi:UPF0716 protein FxsA